MELAEKVSGLHVPKKEHDLSQPILRLAGIFVRFNGTYVLQDISFELKIGEHVAVIGPNGAGKSTLFNVIAGVLSPSRGNVHVYGHTPDEHICIAYVPQRSEVDLTFPVNVADVVMMGRVCKIGFLRRPRRGDWAVVHDALALVAMTHLTGRQIGELSGGQQQRVFIARALAQEAALILLDEPFTGLDAQSQEGIFSIFEKLRQRDVTLLVSTHDLNLAAERFDRLMLLNRQVIGFGRAADVFTPALLSQAYRGQMRLIDTPAGTMVLNDTCCDHGHEGHHHA